MGGLDDRVAVVTGAGAGLGRAVALNFAAEGARVVGVSIDADELEGLRAVAAERGLSIQTELADVGDPERTERLAADVHARLGAVDVLVNNAGIIIVRPIGETSVEDYDRVLATNLRGPFLYCRAFLGPMVTRASGTIINVSSQSGIKGFVGESAYCPSKFGLEGLTRTLALELEGSGVRAVIVTPGAPMHTPMSETTYDAAARARWIDPELIAPGFVALALGDDGISGGRFDAYRVAVDGVDAGRDPVPAG
jgi:NAD(P)-dependent dehydrogenase (short-subunit alcohol dehydrogenase family)